MQVNPRINLGAKEDSCMREGQTAIKHASNASNVI